MSQSDGGAVPLHPFAPRTRRQSAISARSRAASERASTIGPRKRRRARSRMAWLHPKQSRKSTSGAGPGAAATSAAARSTRAARSRSATVLCLARYLRPPPAGCTCGSSSDLPPANWTSRSATGPHASAPVSPRHRSRRTSSLPPGPPSQREAIYAMARSTTTPHALPMGNYVIGVGNCVIVSLSQVGNYLIADAQDERHQQWVPGGRLSTRMTDKLGAPTERGGAGLQGGRSRQSADHHVARMASGGTARLPPC